MLIELKVGRERLPVIQGQEQVIAPGLDRRCPVINILIRRAVIAQARAAGRLCVERIRRIAPAGNERPHRAPRPHYAEFGLEFRSVFKRRGNFVSQPRNVVDVDERHQPLDPRGKLAYQKAEEDTAVVLRLNEIACA